MLSDIRPYTRPIDKVHTSNGTFLLTVMLKTAVGLFLLIFSYDVTVQYLVKSLFQ